MKNFKEKLSTYFGGFGFILWYLITVLISFAPLIFVFNFNPVIDIVIVGVITFIPIIGSIVELVLWIWSLSIALNMPFDIFILMYCIALLIYVVTKLVPAIISLFDRR